MRWPLSTSLRTSAFGLPLIMVSAQNFFILRNVARKKGEENENRTVSIHESNNHIRMIRNRFDEFFERPQFVQSTELVKRFFSTSTEDIDSESVRTC